MTLLGPIPSLSLTSFDQGGSAVVFGASGGIGAALVSNLNAAAQFDRVMGFSRSGPLKFDLLDEDNLAQAAAIVADQGPIRLVIDATGFLHQRGYRPEKTMRELDANNLLHSFAINAVGPALLMKHLLPRFPRSGKALFASLSARVGSIGDNRLGGWYGYRASKAALNQYIKTASVEVARKCPQAICVALHPGTVATDLSAPFAKAGLEVQTPDQSARHLLRVVDQLDASDTGGFFDWSGARVPW